MCSLAADTAGSIAADKTKDLNLAGEGHSGGLVESVGSQSVEKRSPADGRGARPPVTLGRRDRSGRLWMWDLSSFLT